MRVHTLSRQVFTPASYSKTTLSQRTFRALVVSLEGEKPNIKPVHNIVSVDSFDELPAQKTQAKWTDQLATVAVDYSTLNYKDGLVLQGKPGVAKTFPIVPGIDFAGRIISDPTGSFSPDTPVLVTGNYLGQHLNGAYAEQCLVPYSWLLAQPANITGLQAMQIGTAGFTAFQSIDTLEKYHKINKDSCILVLGASGGVGSTAVAILKHLGYNNIVASSGRMEENKVMLEALGADMIIDRLETAKPLDKEEYDAVIDPIGGSVTANVLPRVKYGGGVALSGVAAGPNMEGATVFPFILRGVSLFGIDSVQMNAQERQRVWERVSMEFPRSYFDVMGSQTVGLEELGELSKDILKGKVTGRVVVDVRKELDIKK